MSTGSNLTLVLYSYLDELNVHFIYQRASCPGVFLDSCTVRVIKGNNSINLQSFPMTSHGVLNHFLMEHCEKRMNSPTKFMKFTSHPSKSCATIQVITLQWQYQKREVKFKYHCKWFYFKTIPRAMKCCTIKPSPLCFKVLWYFHTMVFQVKFTNIINVRRLFTPRFIEENFQVMATY